MRSPCRPLPIVLALTSFLLAGCPPGKKEESSSSTASSASELPRPICTKVGQTCEVFGGKLGTCVQRDDCLETPPCFVCQAQH